MSDEYKTEQEIIDELKNEQKLLVINPKITNYPYLQMTPTQLEDMAYYFLSDSNNQIKYFKKAVIIKPGKKVADKGRDVTIFDNGKIVGIGQCKKYQNLVDKNLFYLELTKTILYMLIENCDTTEFKKYFIFAPSGITEDLSDLITDFPNKIDQNDIDNGADRNINTKSKKGHLASINYEDVKDDLTRIIKQLNIVQINKLDLDLFLQTNTSVAACFFDINKNENSLNINNKEKQIFNDIYNYSNIIIRSLNIFDKNLKKYDFNDNYDAYFDNFVKPLHDAVVDLMNLNNTEGLLTCKIGVKKLIDELFDNQPEQYEVDGCFEVGEYYFYYRDKNNFNHVKDICSNINTIIEALI